MKWQRLGLLFNLTGNSSWARHSCLQPTPLRLDAETIRVYLGFRDDHGVSRVGYIDIDAHDPRIVRGVSENPCLEIGEPGAFDDNGVVPCAVVKRDGVIYLYYAGYQVPSKVRFLVYGGLAISTDNGKSFTRHQPTPITDRTPDEILFRVIHTILPIGDTWHAWYGGGSEFEQGKFKTLPKYDIRHMTSVDGVHFPTHGSLVIPLKEGEHRVGRPYVFKGPDRWYMFFGSGSEAVPYRLMYAESADGLAWNRSTTEIGLSEPSEEWDSSTTSYPAVIQTESGWYLLYNGNDYGRTGVGLAKLVEW